MGLKKNRRNAKILPNQTFFGSDDLSYTGPNTSSIVPSCGLHARVARHAKVHLIFRTCRKNYFTLFRKKQTHFASEKPLKQPLCAVFFYALILFPTLSWLISIPRQIPYIKRFCINQEPIVKYWLSKLRTLHPGPLTFALPQERKRELNSAILKKFSALLVW